MSRAILVVEMEAFLKLSADTPSQLRAMDVDRVMSRAYDLRKLEDFKFWILSQPDLQDRTRKEIETWTPE